MIKYLIFPTVAESEARSAQAYIDLGFTPDESTYMLWMTIAHQSDGRGALQVLPTPEDCNVLATQEVYDTLLTNEEKAELIDALPEGWLPDWG